IAFVTNEDGVARLRLLDTATDQEKAAALPGLGRGLIDGLEWHANNHDLAFTFSSARSPADAYSLDTATGKLERWTESETGGLDAGRVMVTGGSYGGYMTLAVAATYADRIRCALDVVGVSNFITFMEKTEAYRRDLRRVEYGDERDPKMREFFTRIAAVNNVD